MGLKNLIFPIALAIVWVAMAAMAMVDFASFEAATVHSRPVVARVAAPAVNPSLPQGRTGARLAFRY